MKNILVSLRVDTQRKKFSEIEHKAREYPNSKKAVVFLFFFLKGTPEVSSINTRQRKLVNSKSHEHR